MKPNTAKPAKKIKLALQGGGAHGAFSWGVLDALLEDGRLDIEAIVGTSAGAMNAATTAYGYLTGGHEGARSLLERFWRKASELGQFGPLKQSPLDRLLSKGDMHFSPSVNFYELLSRSFSPYELNPLNFNPLHGLIDELVDFDVLRQGKGRCALYIAATNVKTGRLKVFQDGELSSNAVMASACLPFLFQAVEVDGEHYWDGGYSGNPPIFPLIYGDGGHDILIIQINPINITEVPRTARDILDRINTLSFNSSLMREMRAIKFVTDLIDQGVLDQTQYPRVNIHTVDAEADLAQYGVSSKLNSDWGFLTHLRDIGRQSGKAFLDQHFDAIGLRSTTDIETKFL